MVRHGESVHTSVGPAESSGDRTRLVDVLARIADSLERLQQDMVRIADHFDPPPPDIVGTPYIANRLSCTTVWVTEMVRTGAIPKACVVEGTGNGKRWKFHRKRIDLWIQRR